MSHTEETDSPRLLSQVLADIVRRVEEREADWSDGGWAPRDAADLLTHSRLDRLVSLSRCLSLWFEPAAPGEEEGRLILAWANLGALVEGMMKLVLSVYLNDYSASPVTRGKMKTPVDPDELQLEQLRQLFCSTVWIPETAERWNAYVGMVQHRRNAIHAYKDREIGDIEEFKSAVIEFLEFLSDGVGNLPEPPSRGDWS